MNNRRPVYPSDAPDDLARLRTEYANREKRSGTRYTYSRFNTAYLFTIQQRERAVLRLLRQMGLYTLADKRVLEVGCGRGGVLLEHLAYGAQPHLLYGTDLLEDRVQDARRLLPHVSLSVSDGQRLPYRSNSFDLVVQYTMLSSILDDAIQINIANEMRRVLCKPQGAVIWYDFWLNPVNPQTRGLRLAAVKRLFPGAAFTVRKITLAPPLARRLAPVSWTLCLLLEKLGLLNTHYLLAIRFPSDS
ncbi:MAG: class I SAM-dependent methyltransferase [Anaerolineae bacterium]|nr:class I SAM-dependent methyltransferase [Anaerolineae bacterium]